MSGYQGFVTLPPALIDMIQTGMLAREFQEGLDSWLAYRRSSVEEIIPARIGQTLTYTRYGRKPPVSTPLNPSNNTNFDNGLTPTDAPIEQYILQMNEWGDTTDVNLVDSQTAIADNVQRVSRNTGVQAAQSLERIARLRLFSAYLGGNTRVRTDLGASTTTTCHVDDIRGFQYVLVNGSPTPVSSVNVLSVTEYNTFGSGIDQTLSVTGVVADSSNQSSVPDGISGTLTFNTATAPVEGDALIAANAPSILRPEGKITTAQLSSSDILTMSMLEDAKTVLSNNAVPPFEDGTYHTVLDNTSMRQLFADQDFKVLYAGRYNSAEYREGMVFTLLGMTFVPTTEAYVQNAMGSSSTDVSVRVRRPIVLGDGSLIEGTSEVTRTWSKERGAAASIMDIGMVNNVALVMRPPLDRLGQWLGVSWVWIGDYAVPTDITATTAIIPTASSALYKRGVVLETAG